MTCSAVARRAQAHHGDGRHPALPPSLARDGERATAAPRGWLSETPILQTLTHTTFPERFLEAGLADRLVEVARPTLSLTDAFSPFPTSADVPIGATKSFGWPDLPAGMAWPRRQPQANLDETLQKARQEDSELAARIGKADGKTKYELKNKLRGARFHLEELEIACSTEPLWFVAQYDFGEFNADAWLGPDYPTSGRLLLFYDMENQPWGYSRLHALGHRVLWDETPPDALTRTEPPLNHWRGPKGIALPERDFSLRMKFQKSLSLPQAEALLSVSRQGPDIGGTSDDPLHLLGAGAEERLDEADVQQAIYFNLSRDVNTDRHRIGGFPSQVQDEMQSECVETADFASRPEDWIFLLQHRDDEHCWGDDGLLFLWIHRDDLRSRRFDRTHLVLQCW